MEYGELISHLSFKGESRDPNMHVAHYLDNGWRYRHRYSGAHRPIGNGTWAMKWSRDRSIYSCSRKMVWDTDSVATQHL